VIPVVTAAVTVFVMAAAVTRQASCYNTPELSWLPRSPELAMSNGARPGVLKAEGNQPGKPLVPEVSRP
jgi:hypothetical protein